MAAAASSAELKRQSKPSGGSERSRYTTDRSGDSSSVLPALKDLGLGGMMLSSSSSTSVASSSASSSSSSSRSPASSTQIVVDNKSYFIPYLPHDDAVAAGLGADRGGIDAVETQRVADLLNEELCRLLRMPPLEFWQAVTTDSCIEVSLDSYLQFRRRWYDIHADGGDKPLAGVIVGDQELFRRVFMVLYRMSLRSENRAHHTSDSSLSEEHAVIFQRRFFDIPKLLDVCSIYGCENRGLTRKLVKNAFAINGGLFDDLANIMPIISNTVRTMQQRCLSTLSMQLLTEPSEMSLRARICQELLEILDYLNDAVISLCTFLDVYSEGALILVLAGNYSDSRDHILLTLEAIHDSLIPTVCKCFSRLQGHFTDAERESAVERRSKRLRFGLIDLVWRLFCFSYLKENSFADSQDGFVNHLLQMYVYNPKARGEGLVQVLSGMVEESSRSFAEGTLSGGALIRNVDRKYKFLERISQLRKKGAVSLDAVQYDYIEAIVTQTTGFTSVSLPHGSELAPVSQELSEIDVLNESKISHIKDILPDYGAGFISACLEAYDNNPEEVIQRILEGTLHATLQSLDTTLELKPDSKKPSLPVKDKGKGKVHEEPSQNTNTINDRVQKPRWQGEINGFAQRHTTSVSTSNPTAKEDGRGSSSKIIDHDSTKDFKGRFVRKDKGEESSQALLNECHADDVLRTVAYAAQYEDEYDDSFDDLGTSIADRVEETEILVDLARSKASVRGERGSSQDSRISMRSSAIGRGGWAGSSSFTQEAKVIPKQENRSAVSDSQRKGPPPVSRGRGRGKRHEQRGQFYVKDGMHYSYRVAGSVAVASVEDAEELKKKERETIHGLGQGGNVPTSGDQTADRKVTAQGNLQTNSRSIPGGELSGRGGAHSRGRGAPRKDHDHHRRKDRAMQKHFASLGGM